MKPNEITKERYFEIVETATGKKIGKDYGFILGTHAPYLIERGMFSATNREGYTIWRKEEDETTYILNVTNFSNSIATTIAFLSAPLDTLETIYGEDVSKVQR